MCRNCYFVKSTACSWKVTHITCVIIKFQDFKISFPFLRAQIFNFLKKIRYDDDVRTHRISHCVHIRVGQIDAWCCCEGVRMWSQDRIAAWVQIERIEGFDRRRGNRDDVSEEKRDRRKYSLLEFLWECSGSQCVWTWRRLIFWSWKE